MSATPRGLHRLKGQLEDIVTVRMEGAFYSARIALCGGPSAGAGTRAGMDRATHEEAAADAKALLDTLFFGIWPVAQSVFTEACGCTEADASRCGEKAAERLGLGVVAFCGCPRCHPVDASGERGGSW